MRYLKSCNYTEEMEGKENVKYKKYGGSLFGV